MSASDATDGASGHFPNNVLGQAYCIPALPIEQAWLIYSNDWHLEGILPTLKPKGSIWPIECNCVH